MQLPAFRADPRCEVVALAGSDEKRTAELARAANVPKGYGDWRALVEDKTVDAVAIATMPALQPQIAQAALALGKPVFAEKPMASTLADARSMLRAAKDAGKPAMIDFNFHQMMSWQRAKAMLDDGAIGRLRHLAVHWHVENRSIQMRMRNWKTLTDDGGGVLGNFIWHCFHYLEWFCGPVARLSARLSACRATRACKPPRPWRSNSRRGPLASLSMSCASFLGGGHRLEFYGEDGTLVLSNATSDYMRGFELLHAKRPAAALARIAVEDPDDARYPDGRIAPVSRLAKQFLDAIEKGGNAQPDFAAGYRVQQLIDAAQRSQREGKMDRDRCRGRWSVEQNPGHRRLGFIGSALVKALVRAGAQRARARRQFARVRRAGSPASRRTSNSSPATFATRPPSNAATRGMDEVHHLAFVNGTEFFYSAARAGARRRRARHGQCDRRLPQARCRHAGARLHRRRSIRRRRKVPTAEDAPLVVPDVLNPRYSYGAGKLISEVMAINFGRKYLRARSHLPPAQCLRPGHGLGARHPAIRAAPAPARRQRSRQAHCASTFRAPAPRRAASATSTTWWPASW